MAIVFHVEDQLHNRGASVADDLANSFLELARRLTLAGSRVFDIIDPYADAMFNYIQLDRLLGELDEALQGHLTPSERDVAMKVQAAAREARSLSGYLFVEGN